MRNKMKVNLRIILCYLLFVIGVALIIFSMNMIIHMFDLFAMKEILKLIGCCFVVMCSITYGVALSYLAICILDEVPKLMNKPEE